MRQMLSFGPFSVDIVRRVVMKNGKPVRMTLKCVELLIAFVRNPGKTLSKEILIEAAWHDTPASDATLAQHVFLLRRSLRAAGEDVIQTVPQIGYRFTAAVEGHEPNAAPVAVEYVDGGDTFGSLQTEQGLRSAIDLYTRAIAVDERNVRAYARRARCRRFLAEFMYADPYSSLMAAKSDAASALSCDPSDADARIEAAYSAALFDRDCVAASRHVDVAEQHDPHNAAIPFARVSIALMRGDIASASAASRRYGGMYAGTVLFFAREFSRAIPYFEGSASTDPSATLMLNACRLLMGDVGTAMREFRAIYREHIDIRHAGRPNVRHYALALFIYSLAKSGDRTRARRAVADLAALARQRFVSPMARAIAHIGLGETEVAISFLEEAIERFDPWAAYLALDPIVDEVRDDARFKRLLGQLAA
jgi:DNA-binding winged helix-turn-helix (wHTH) protein/tetratricopeptide (TPR) repeat protein